MPAANSPSTEAPRADPHSAASPSGRQDTILDFHAALFAAEQPTAALPTTALPTANRPDADRPDAEQPDAEQPHAEQPDADQPHADQPDSDQPDASAFATAPGSPAWRVAGWGSETLQRVRFEALLRTSGYRGGSVLDWGCGPADLYFFLRTTNHPLHYTGIDLNPRMTDLAAARGVPGVTATSTPEGTYDYVFASGIFQFDDPDDPFYYLQILEQGYDISRRAVAVNFLSAERPEHTRSPDELYADPSVLARFAAALTPRWVLDHGYHPEGADFTLALLH